MTHYSSTGGGCPQLGGFEAAVLLLVFDSVEALDPVEVGLRLSSGGRLLWTRSQNDRTSDRQDCWRAFSIESKLRFCSWVFFWVKSWWDFVIHGLIQDAAHAVKGKTPSHPKQIITTCKFDSKSSHINLIYLYYTAFEWLGPVPLWGRNARYGRSSGDIFTLTEILLTNILRISWQTDLTKKNAET